eukprot:4244090-Pleurochrysis_carterae.AAC.1
MGQVWADHDHKVPKDPGRASLKMQLMQPPRGGRFFGRSEMAKAARNETLRSVSRRSPRVDPKKGNEIRVYGPVTGLVSAGARPRRTGRGCNSGTG